MNKFYGPIGYAIPTETRPGYWEDRIEEHNYYGDVVRLSTRWAPSPDSTNDDLNINNQISIVADQFANNHCHSMKYVRFMGANWKITNVEPRHPRLILTVGGVYNGPTSNAGTT
jgi:hypothetical protein